MRKLCNHWKEERQTSWRSDTTSQWIEKHLAFQSHRTITIASAPEALDKATFYPTISALHHRPATPISRFRNHLVCPPYTRITSASRLQRDPEFCDFSMNLITTAMRERDCAWTRALQSTSRSCDHLA
ncbi:hypothetical protein HBI56_099810 [Parastagonospora nodorum]|nr:hypothetical protein HBH51_084380 [Parastagonospora nodorum]KAH4175898.1 hypothetical protein HBH43_068440 [Parastagonospora nodorum]KAH4953330.1 hypothetical protein HBH74_005160 [Parastagonospora nodorum]KAH5108010.1 hypothetical protein HBH72_044700 [Parastagonospora nodorum]KAH5612675.1 hypothetical protein HBI45_055480 [Parastagonospora nodorum]